MPIETTVATPAGDKAGTDTPTEPQVTTPPSDTGGRTAEDRIAGLIAERGRRDTTITDLQKQLTDLTEKNKSDEDKRIDELVTQRVESEYGPIKLRLNAITDGLTTKRDKLLEAMPETSRNCYDDTAPIEVQVRQIELVAAHLSDKAPPVTPVDAGGNPPAGPTKDTRVYSRAEINEWQQMPSKGRLDEYRELRPGMVAALKEGRIK